MRNIVLFMWAILITCLVACAANQPKPDNDSIRERAQTAYGELDKSTNSSNKTNSSPNHEFSNSSFSSDVSTPVLMVLPAISGNSSSAISVVSNNPFAKTTMESANEYLTEKGYEVLSLEGNEELNQLIEIQSDISEGEEDMSYLASLALGADIYIKFSGAIREDMVSVELSAYETSTARLLGSKTGMVKNHTRNEENHRYLIQTAVKKALSGLEGTILSNWEKDRKQGVPYKVIMRIGERFSEQSLENLQDNSISILRSKFSSIKVNRLTDKTMDFVLYANPAEYPDAYAVYANIRESLSNLAIASKNNITSKLIIMDLN